MATHRTNKGQTIDMDALFNANKAAPAIGNMKVNANGDVIDSRGNVVKKKEDRVREYYRDNPKSSTSQSLRGEQPTLQADTITPQQAPKTAKTAAANITPDPIQEPDEFGAPDDMEPIGYKELHLPSGDIEMVPIYKKDPE